MMTTLPCYTNLLDTPGPALQLEEHLSCPTLNIRMQYKPFPSICQRSVSIHTIEIEKRDLI